MTVQHTIARLSFVASPRSASALQVQLNVPTKKHEKKGECKCTRSLVRRLGPVCVAFGLHSRFGPSEVTPKISVWGHARRATSSSNVQWERACRLPSQLLRGQLRTSLGRHKH